MICPGPPLIHAKSKKLNLALVKPRRHQAIRFLLVLGHVPGGNAFAAGWAKYGAMVLGKVHDAVNNTVVVHFDKVAFAYFLIVGNKCFAVGAVYGQYVAAAYFFAVGVRGHGCHALFRCFTAVFPVVADKHEFSNNKPKNTAAHK